MPDVGRATAAQSGAMNTPTAPMTSIQSSARLRIWVHLLIATTAGIVSPFTGFAWPFALLVGMILGADGARRMRGERTPLGDTVAIAFVAALGILGMLFFGAIIGGLIAIPIAILASFNEKVAAETSSIDRGVARILLFVVPIVMWLVVFPLLGLNVDISIGS
jgi:ABC-type phosphate/phosphonate transport system permease subunit